MATVAPESPLGRIILALIHFPVLNKRGDVIASSVTTLDVHDIARVARTYELGGYYIVTPLPYQRRFVGRLLRHWYVGGGVEYNPSRRRALLGIRVAATLREVVDREGGRAGSRPCVVATSARRPEGVSELRLTDLARGLAHDPSARAILAFGTGWGLSPEFYNDVDGVLEPIRGPGPYNHLSVRSAASIIVDRLSQVVNGNV